MHPRSFQDRRALPVLEKQSAALDQEARRSLLETNPDLARWLEVPEQQARPPKQPAQKRPRDRRITGERVTRPLLANWQVRSRPTFVVVQPVSAPSTVVVCKVVRIDAGQAVCTVTGSGVHLPEVGFPLSLLSQKGLTVGSEFRWVVRGGPVQAADILPGPPPNELSPDEKAELARSRAAFKQRMKTRGPRPESPPSTP